MALALLLKEQGRLSDTVKVLSKARKRFPESTEIKTELARAYEAVGDIPNALDLGRELAGSFPTNLELQRFFGRLSMRSGLIEDAEATFRFILTKAPDDSAVLNDLAWLLRHNEDSLDEALQFARRSIALDPMNPNAWDTLSALRKKTGDLDGALEAIERAINLSEAPHVRLLKRRDRLMQDRKAIPDLP
jgi:tetratricopeptide (TPR) repeat protein